MVGIILLQDITFSGLLTLALLSGGIANAVYSSNSDDFYEDYEPLCEHPEAGEISIVENFCDDLKRIRDSQAAAAVSCRMLLSTHPSIMCYMSSDALVIGSNIRYYFKVVASYWL